MRRTQPIRIAIAYGDGVGREIISKAADVLRAAFHKYSVHARLLPFEPDFEGIGYEAQALSRGCDAVLMSPLKEETELEMAALLGAPFCFMPVTCLPQLGEKHTSYGQKLRPSACLSFVVMQTLYSRYSKESIDKSKIFETVATDKADFKKALDFSMQLSGGKQKIVIVKMGVDDYYQKEITQKFENSAADIDIVSANEFAGSIYKMKNTSCIVLAPCVEGELLHTQAMLLLSEPSLCYKVHMGVPRLYMPMYSPLYANAGTGSVCPAGAILAGAEMMKDLGHIKCAGKIKKSVFTVLDNRFKTADIAAEGDNIVSTDTFAALVIEELLK